MTNLCYSLAIDNNLAQLYASWKHVTSFYIQHVDSFLLSSPEHFARLHQRVTAILEWGRGQLLGDIRLALEYIGEKQRMLASGAAKSRPGPEQGNNGSERKRRRQKGP